MSVLGFYRILHDGLTCQNQLVGGQAFLSVIKVTRAHVFSDSNTEIHHHHKCAKPGSPTCKRAFKNPMNYFPHV